MFTDDDRLAGEKVEPCVVKIEGEEPGSWRGLRDVDERNGDDP